MTTLANKLFEFYSSLCPPQNLPPGVEVMNPYNSEEIRQIVKDFLNKYFSDNNKRVLVLGINPGRFGAGTTGVNFTDPVALEKHCAIPNNLTKKQELSSVYIYKFINLWGGPEKFYQQFYLSALSPLGFTKSGKNYNYYDDKDMLTATLPYIIQSIKQQIDIVNCNTSAIIFGTGKNFDVFSKLNFKYEFFNNIYALEHPRFIMQYQKQRIDHFLQKYQEVFTRALSG